MPGTVLETADPVVSKSPAIHPFLPGFHVKQTLLEDLHPPTVSTENTFSKYLLGKQRMLATISHSAGIFSTEAFSSLKSQRAHLLYPPEAQ